MNTIDNMIIFVDKKGIKREAKLLTNELSPYLEYEYVVKMRERRYNPKYGDNRICECGHTYYRHFDSYENMDACGCKYCACDTFKEKVVTNQIGTCVCCGKETGNELFKVCAKCANEIKV